MVGMKRMIGLWGGLVIGVVGIVLAGRGVRGMEEEEVGMVDIGKDKIEGKQELRFETDVKKLLRIFSQSVYADTDCWLRELISNGSDACARKILEIEDAGAAEEQGEAGDFEPRRIWVYRRGNKFYVEDNGCGMSEEEVKRNLGTIALSGTHERMREFEKQQKDASQLIGRHGVGFYSVFMHGKSVKVVTRKVHGKVVVFAANMNGSFTVATKKDLSLSDSDRFVEREIHEEVEEEVEDDEEEEKEEEKEEPEPEQQKEKKKKVVMKTRVEKCDLAGLGSSKFAQFEARSELSGTRIEIDLDPKYAARMSITELKRILQKYLEFVDFEVKIAVQEEDSTEAEEEKELQFETMRRGVRLWQRNIQSKKIEESEYQQFYQQHFNSHVSSPNDDPLSGTAAAPSYLAKKHIVAEGGLVNYRAIIFLPRTANMFEMLRDDASSSSSPAASAPSSADNYDSDTSKKTSGSRNFASGIELYCRGIFVGTLERSVLDKLNECIVGVVEVSDDSDLHISLNRSHFAHSSSNMRHILQHLNKQCHSLFSTALESDQAAFLATYFQPIHLALLKSNPSSFNLANDPLLNLLKFHTVSTDLPLPPSFTEPTPAAQSDTFLNLSRQSLHDIHSFLSSSSSSSAPIHFYVAKSINDALQSVHLSTFALQNPHSFVLLSDSDLSEYLFNALQSYKSHPIQSILKSSASPSSSPFSPSSSSKPAPVLAHNTSLFLSFVSAAVKDCISACSFMSAFLPPDNHLDLSALPPAPPNAPNAAPYICLVSDFGLTPAIHKSYSIQKSVSPSSSASASQSNPMLNFYLNQLPILSLNPHHPIISSLYSLFVSALPSSNPVPLANIAYLLRNYAASAIQTAGFDLPNPAAHFAASSKIAAFYLANNNLASSLIDPAFAFNPTQTLNNCISALNSASSSSSDPLHSQQQQPDSSQNYSDLLKSFNSSKPSSDPSDPPSSDPSDLLKNYNPEKLREMMRSMGIDPDKMPSASPHQHSDHSDHADHFDDPMKGFDPSKMADLMKGFDPSKMAEMMKGFDADKMGDLMKGFDPSKMDDLMKGFDPSKMDDLVKGFDPSKMDEMMKGFDPSQFNDSLNNSSPDDLSFHHDHDHDHHHDHQDYDDDNYNYPDEEEEEEEEEDKDENNL